MMKQLMFLLADDDRDDRDFFKDALKLVAPAAAITSVNDGQKAVQYLEACADDALPDVILLDYNMSHMNGPQVLDWICSRERYNGINKFIWSTAVQQEYIDGCISKGAVAYFVKPNSEEEIQDIVRKILTYFEN